MGEESEPGRGVYVRDAHITSVVQYLCKSSLKMLRGRKKKSLTNCKNLDLVFSHCAETWALLKSDIKRVEALEMWCWRRKVNVSWMDKVPKKEVKRRVNESEDITDIINIRKNPVKHALRRT